MSTQTVRIAKGKERKRIIAIVTGIIAVLAITWFRKMPSFTVDPVFGLAHLPLDEPYKLTSNLIMIIGLGIFGLIGAAFGIRDLIKEKTWLPLMVSLSGFMIAIPEIIFDVLGGVYYPTSDADHAFTLFNRQMGWFIVVGWFGFGAFNYFTFKLLQKRPSTKQIWMILVTTAIGDLVFEEIILTLGGIYVYYGNQPLVVGQLPWWWIPCNSIGVFLAAAIAYRYQKELQGLKSLAMFFITPFSTMAAYGFIAIPCWIVVNGHYSWILTQGAGLLTVTLGFFLAAMSIRLVLKRDPWDLSGNELEVANN